MAMLEDSQAGFICLQEVTGRVLEAIHKVSAKGWVKDYYMSVVPMGWYDTVILSKLKCRFYKRNFKGSFMQRCMLLAELFVENGDNIMVGSMHYESLNHEKERIAQMNEVHETASKACRVIIAGDYNFSDNMPENK